MTPVELSRTVLHAVRRAVDDGELSVTVPERAVVTEPGPGGCGDFATTIALQLARPAGRPPQRVAEILRNRLVEADGIRDVVVTGPGFLNISLDEDADPVAGLVREIREQGVRYGYGDALAGQVLALRVPYEVRAEVVADAVVRLVGTQGGRATVEHGAPVNLRPVPAPEDPAPLGPDAAQWALLHPAAHDRPRITADHLVQREGNPLFRVRYAHARVRSVSRNAARLGFTAEPGPLVSPAESGPLVPSPLSFDAESGPLVPSPLSFDAESGPLVPSPLSFDAESGPLVPSPLSFDAESGPLVPSPLSFDAESGPLVPPPSSFDAQPALLAPPSPFTAEPAPLAPLAPPSPSRAAPGPLAARPHPPAGPHIGTAPHPGTTLAHTPHPDAAEVARPLLAPLADHPRILAAAATHRAPDRLARHLVTVADAVLPLLPFVLPLGEEKPSAAHRARLALAEAAGTVLAGGLSLLGIDAPEHL
ncbi:ArgS-related anticodon-binding protein NrtL [Streptomyces naphthomycinicus]|uniref:ArgS-related anticodon-binding protein NrtL n=1 Tax=Streptomyces naphthomycinicus TaxID=2872625 RepID=UPI00288B352D|nr:DALR anticodon-binding domain-containing protein [Streptomyces sp. TML10]